MKCLDASRHNFGCGLLKTMTLLSSPGAAILSPCGGWNLHQRSNVNSPQHPSHDSAQTARAERHVRSIIDIHPSLKASHSCRTEPAGCSRTRALTLTRGVVSANRAARGSFPIKESHHNRTRSGPSRSFSPRIPLATTSHRTPPLPPNGLASPFHLRAPPQIIQCQQTRCITSLVPHPRTVQLLCTA